LRDNRIELVRASWHELSISVSDVSLSDEGQYTCSLFTMPVKTSKAFLTVLGVPEKPQITGFTSPVMEGERMQLTCKTSGSKPAADIRWFKNDKEVKDYMKQIFLMSPWRDVDGGASESTQLLLSSALIGSKLNKTKANNAITNDISMAYTLSPLLPLTQILAFISVTEQSNQLSPVVLQPEPVLWTKDGGELPDPERMVVNGRVLSISFLNKTDNGTYRCEAKNPIGRNSTEYVLIVH
ncbi:CADM2 protein, partial [Corythaeola cristata]|nr:CADM2 protein [Corythaeola cristata]